MLIALLCSTIASAATGRIAIHTEDAPGEVILDGLSTGEHAPTVLSDVPVGRHEVFLRYGCQAGRAWVDVARKTTVDAKLVLEDMGGEGIVRLDGMPRVATVTLDGEPIDAEGDSFTAPCGTRIVGVVAPGFDPWETEVLVTTDQWVGLRPELVVATLVEDSAPVAASADEEEGWDDLDSDPEFDGLTAPPPPVEEEPEDPPEDPPEDTAISAADRLAAARAAMLAAESQAPPPPEPEPAPEPEPELLPPPPPPPSGDAARAHILVGGLTGVGALGLGYGLYHHGRWAGAKDKATMVQLYFGVDSPQAAAYADSSVKPQKNRMLIGYAVGGAATLGAAGLGVHAVLTGSGLAVHGRF